MKVSDFWIEEVPRKSISDFIVKHHYSHSMNGVQSYYHFGLYTEGNFGLPKMIGAMLYAIPSMPDTAKKYNNKNPNKCYEIRRLVCVDDTPKNTESFFLSQTFKWLRQNTNIETVISFADENEGHTGIIYKASNFFYLGTTSPGKTLIVDGKSYHPRTLNQIKRPYGREIKRRYEAGDENIFFKDTKPKHIYIFFLSKKAKKSFDFGLFQL